MKTRYQDISPYITKDGSQIRELMHPAVHGNTRQSLAEATVQPGRNTQLHRHRLSEELYFVTQGAGLMVLGEETFRIEVGDTVLIAPGTPHCVEATGNEALHVLCCCSPAYSHEDTLLIDTVSA